MKLGIEKRIEKKVFFLLDDQDLEKLSQIDHDKVITKLGLAIDDSIILKYEQFKEIADILEVNSWVQKGFFKNHLRISDVSYFNETTTLVKFLLKQVHLSHQEISKMMINYFSLRML